VGLDVTFRMLQRARRRGPAGAGHDPRVVTGDMLALPFPDRSFSVVTVGYGLRNVPDLQQSLREIRRVVAPEGRVLSLDFNRPANRGVRIAYLAYLTLVGSSLGWLLHRDPDTYRYIPASLRTYPGAAGVADRLKQRGFVRVVHHPVLGGLMAIHIATVPATTPQPASGTPAPRLR
jgi:demethylmenaquinone methyltransferase/2-methoxy-6-polyprenyl-1,4-benzoquinol methylase